MYDVIGLFMTPDREGCVHIGERCPAGKSPAADKDGCDPCTKFTYSRSGAPCELCDAPNYVTEVKVNGKIANTDCQRCPEGTGPNENRNACVKCTGNSFSSSSKGECTPCKYGETATDDHSGCNPCPERETYIDGYSNETGECGCGTQGGDGNNGFYDASDTLIVCFHDGYKTTDVEEVYKTMSKTFGSTTSTRRNYTKCQECPACVDCSQGYPKLRDGYTVGTTVVTDVEGRRVGLPDSELQPEITFPTMPHISDGQKPKHWYVHYAFFCDEDTAVTPSVMTEMHYFTSRAANQRCNHTCNASVCSQTAQSLVLPVLRAEIDRYTAFSRGTHQQLDTDQMCSTGYEGHFCRSCRAAEHGPNILDRIFKGSGSDSIQYFKPPGHSDTCVECPVGDTLHYHVIALPLVGLVVAAIVALWRKYKRSRDHTDDAPATPVVMRASSGNMVEDARLDASLDENEKGRGAKCWERLGQVKIALFPAIRILITYAQVTGQLGHVLHVQYPETFTSTVGNFKFLLDLWSLIFTPECAGLGSFYAKWWLRIVCQPVLVAGIVYSVYFVDRLWKITGVGPKASEAAKNTLRQNLLRGIFLCYPGVCNVAFSALDCRFDSPTTQVLVDDDRISCDDNEHERYKIASIGVILFFGFGLPIYCGYQVYSKAQRAEEELSGKRLVAQRAQQELIPSDLSEQEQAERFWRRGWRSIYCGVCSRCGCCPCASAESWGEDPANKKMLQWNQDKAARKLVDRVEDAYIESTSLMNYTSLTEAYRPQKWLVYWESVDMLRKLTLVGLVVLAGRGSVAQNMASSIVSFFFFALHVKTWPMKMAEDNILRATCEFHVFWTITTAFVMKSDLSHERLDPEFYDWALLITGFICVPFTFVVAMMSKRRRYRDVPSADLSAPSAIPASEFVRFSIGLASSSDREQLRVYFEKRSKNMEVALAFEKLATKEEVNGRETPAFDVSNLEALLQELLEEAAEAGRPIEEPALSDIAKLAECKRQLKQVHYQLPGHLQSTEREGSAARARISTMRSTHVVYLEFIAWWEARHGSDAPLAESTWCCCSTRAEISPAQAPLLAPLLADGVAGSDTAMISSGSGAGSQTESNGLVRDSVNTME